jgi:hypothetical protein
MATSDGAHDFDFLIGDWLVRHRRLARRLVGDTEWIEFSGRATARKILGGWGNIDEYQIDLPAGAYVGGSLRLFNPATQAWTIYWMDSRNPKLDPPMVGRFKDGEGLFLGDDTWSDRPIRIRFVWSALPGRPYRWEQAFSADAGVSWETNWTMTFTPIATA